MVNFIKPLYLGTEREFANLYANPIKNGQHKDSSKKDITVMKQRSYVLHKKLSKFVQALYVATSTGFYSTSSRNPVLCLLSSGTTPVTQQSDWTKEAKAAREAHRQSGEFVGQNQSNVNNLIEINLVIINSPRLLLWAGSEFSFSNHAVHKQISVTNPGHP
ncbi:uncharacterized protein LOC123037680 [Drosophila rhopaloa]|uniref:Uncharacterized protein n=1 Tax=Drosophila rhopaloa TaxID=1041015 RepID=A0ABM5J905_DRORH|nr:uncharacterized protein LOC123037680 [Drosophila rhopaloa]